MSIAICIFGPCTRWDAIIRNILSYYNEPNIHILTENYPIISSEKITNISWSKLNYIVPKFTYNNNTMYKYYIKTCVEQLLKMVQSKYDTIIFYYGDTLYFEKIVQKGIHVPYELKTYGTYNPKSCRVINTLKVQMEGVKFIGQLSIEIRKNIFQSLFAGKVCDFTYFAVNPSFFTSQTPIFLIPSVIRISTEKQSRTIFTTEERLKQTIKQLKSIKEKMPHSKVYVLEVSQFLTLDEMERLAKYADNLILFSKDKLAQFYAHVHIGKNHTELYLLNQMIPLFDQVSYGWLCKYGARYHLTDSFDYKKFLSDKPSFKVIPKSWDNKPIIESILYSFPKTYISFVKDTIKHILKDMDESSILLDNEHEWMNHLIKNNISINNMESLGVKGFVSHDGSYNII